MRRDRPRKRTGTTATAGWLSAATVGLPLLAAVSYLWVNAWLGGALLLPWLLLVWVDRSLKGGR